MSRRLPVFSAGGPAISFNNYVLASLINHWLYCNAHTIFNEWTSATASKVWNFRVFVELTSHAMTTHLSHHAVTTLFAVVLNGVTDVADAISRNCSLDTLVERLFS